MWTSEQEVDVKHLKPGMYVSRLDRPWIGTSFPIQGFYVQDIGDVEKIQRYCEHVFIDVYKSNRSPACSNNLTLSGDTKPKANKLTSKSVVEQLRKRATEKYTITNSFKREIAQAVPILKNLQDEMQHLMAPRGYIDRHNFRKLANQCSDLVESVIRNPDAMVWLCRVKQNNTLVYRHALRLALLGCLVGRQFGLNRFLMVDLTLALLMTGIGKSLIRQDVLDNVRFNHAPAAYQQHVHLSLDRISKIQLPGINIGDIIANYCERMDGSGYPLGKTSEDIPLLASIAGLIECFELQVNPYNPNYAVAPSDAITELNRVKNTLFDPALVEKFVHTIGIYPTGTLVELNDQRIGIVCSQSYERRLRASIIPLTTRHGQAVEKFKIVDLFLPNQWQLNNNKIRITKGLPISTLPPPLLDAAYGWLIKKNYGVWGKMTGLLS